MAIRYKRLLTLGLLLGIASPALATVGVDFVGEAIPEAGDDYNFSVASTEGDDESADDTSGDWPALMAVLVENSPPDAELAEAAEFGGATPWIVSDELPNGPAPGGEYQAGFLGLDSFSTLQTLASGSAGEADGSNAPAGSTNEESGTTESGGAGGGSGTEAGSGGAGSSGTDGATTTTEGNSGGTSPGGSGAETTPTDSGTDGSGPGSGSAGTGTGVDATNGAGETTNEGATGDGGSATTNDAGNASGGSTSGSTSGNTGGNTDSGTSSGNVTNSAGGEAADGGAGATGPTNVAEELAGSLSGGAGTPAPSAVPEPTTFALWCLAGVALISIVRRRE